MGAVRLDGFDAGVRMPGWLVGDAWALLQADGTAAVTLLTARPNGALTVRDAECPDGCAVALVALAAGEPVPGGPDVWDALAALPYRWVRSLVAGREDAPENVRVAAVLGLR